MDQVKSKAGIFVGIFFPQLINFYEAAFESLKNF